MAYLNLDLDYFDHPKVVRLVGQLGRGADLLPVRLWCYCGKYHADSGELIGYSPLEIETAIKWWGPAGRAVESLISMGFLDKCENGFQVHDWEAINGHIAALRERGQVAAEARWAKYRDANAMHKHSPSNAPGNAPTIPTSPTINPPLPPRGKRERKIFVKPTPEQVQEYCDSRRNGIIGSVFCDWYEARGWRTKTGPVVDWQACVRTWEAREKEKANGQPVRKKTRVQL